MSLYNKYEALDVESLSMDDVYNCPSTAEMLPGHAQNHNHLHEDDPLQKGTEGPIFLTDHPLREV